MTEIEALEAWETSGLSTDILPALRITFETFLRVSQKPAKRRERSLSGALWFKAERHWKRCCAAYADESSDKNLDSLTRATDLLGRIERPWSPIGRVI